MTTQPPPPASPSPTSWLEGLSLPTALVRELRFADVNAAFCRLLGYTREALVGQPFDLPVAPEDRERVRERHLARVRGEQVTDVYELTALRRDGGRLAVEMHVSRAETGTVVQLYDVSDRAARHHNLQALARLGAAVQREPDEPHALARVEAGIAELGAVLVRLAVEPDAARVVSVSSGPAQPPPPLVQALSSIDWRHAPSFELAWSQGASFVDDLPTAVTRRSPPQAAEAIGDRMRARGLSVGAFVRIDVGGRPSELLFIAAPWLKPEDEATLRLFALQVGSALETARAVRSLERRNADLTSLDLLAKTASEARDDRELFARVGPLLQRLTASDSVAVYRVDEGATQAVLSHASGFADPVAQGLRFLPLPANGLGRVVVERRPLVGLTRDLSEAQRAALARVGQAAYAVVPMVFRSRLVGVVAAGRVAEIPYGPEDLDLLNAMAAHLAAALEANQLVADLRRSVEQLSTAQARLVQRERLAALGEMSAAVAHEVRNPLAVIFNALAAARRAPGLAASVTEMLEMVLEEAERIDTLIHELVDLARPAELQLTEGVPLAALVHESVDAVLRGAPSTVSFELVNAFDGAVPLDPRQMRQAFVNLTTNAVQAMPQGGTLAVSIGRAVTEPGAVEVTFRDTGHGVPAEVQARVFEPFFTTRAQGTGLGLTLVRRIVEAHRGEVVFESRGGAGTRVTLRLPVAGESAD